MDGNTAHLSVRILSVCYTFYPNNTHPIIDEIDDTVRTDTDTPKSTMPNQFLGTCWVGILC